MNKLKTEVIAILGLLVGAAEAALTAVPSGTLHDEIAVAVPVIAGIIGRAHVVPAAKVFGDVSKTLPLVLRLERIIQDFVQHKQSLVSTVEHVVKVIPSATAEINTVVGDVAPKRKPSPRKPAAKR